MPLFVYDNANSILGNTVDFSSFAMGLYLGIPFWALPIPLMPTISPFSYIRMYVAKGQTPCFPKGLENIVVPLLFSLCVCHFDELLEGGGSGRKAQARHLK